MSKVLNEKKRICRIANNCVLPELHCITGPVKRARLTKDEIVKLVRNGRTLYEIDPDGKQPEVKLTMYNCTESPFKNEDNASKADAQQVSTVQNVQPEKKEFQNNKWDNKNKHNKNNNFQKQNQNNQPQEAEKNETEEALTQGDV